MSNVQKDAPEEYLEGLWKKNWFGSGTTILRHIFTLAHLTKYP